MIDLLVSNRTILCHRAWFFKTVFSLQFFIEPHGNGKISLYHKRWYIHTMVRTTQIPLFELTTTDSVGHLLRLARKQCGKYPFWLHWTNPVFHFHFPFLIRFCSIRTNCVRRMGIAAGNTMKAWRKMLISFYSETKTRVSRNWDRGVYYDCEVWISRVCHLQQ